MNTVYTKTENDNAGIINDMYHSWNTFKDGVVALLYRNSAEAWIGLINKYDNGQRKYFADQLLGLNQSLPTQWNRFN